MRADFFDNKSQYQHNGVPFITEGAVHKLRLHIAVQTLFHVIPCRRPTFPWPRSGKRPGGAREPQCPKLSLAF